MATAKYDKKGAEARRKLAISAEDNRRKFKAEWRGYVNFRPTEEHKANFAAWSAEVDFADILRDSAAKGEKLSSYWDERNASFVASIFVRDEDSVNAGLILTARGIDPITAIYRVFYFVGCCMPDDWSQHVAQTGDGW